MRPVPNYVLEAAALDGLPPGAHVCGVDEAGRGPIAGPVVAAAVVLDPTRIPSGIEDSKRLTPMRRSRIAEVLFREAVVGVGMAEVDDIERLNVLGATMLAMCRAIEALPTPVDLALIDGNRVPGAESLRCALRAVVRGDQQSLSIAAASIIAKTRRDSIMRSLANEYPGYGWERNAGYPTAEHLDALGRLGTTPHHRSGFAPVRRVLREGQRREGE